MTINTGFNVVDKPQTDVSKVKSTNFAMGIKNLFPRIPSPNVDSLFLF